MGALAEQNKLQRFMTLTLDQQKIPAGVDSVAYIRDCWRKMREYLRRHFGCSVAFISSLEAHPGDGPNRGVAHLHVLVGVYIPQQWLSRAWSAVGGSRVVHIRFVDVHRVAAYLSKYLTKERLGELPDGVRRFTLSKGLVLWLKGESRSGWTLCAVSIECLYELASVKAGERFEKLPDGSRVLCWFVSDEMVPAATVSWPKYSW